MTSWLICGLVSVLVSGACGGDPPAAPTDPSPAVGVGTATAPAPEAPKAHPTTEKELIAAFAEAVSARDLAAMRALMAPEQGADLHRLYTADAGAFWGRGQRWVDNASTGFELSAKQQGREDRWRALVTFGNGVEETVVFTRLEGKLVFEQL